MEVTDIQDDMTIYDKVEDYEHVDDIASSSPVNQQRMNSVGSNSPSKSTSRSPKYRQESKFMDASDVSRKSRSRSPQIKIERKVFGFSEEDSDETVPLRTRSPTKSTTRPSNSYSTARTGRKNTSRKVDYQPRQRHEGSRQMILSRRRRSSPRYRNEVPLREHTCRRTESSRVRSGEKIRNSRYWEDKWPPKHMFDVVRTELTRCLNQNDPAEISRLQKIIQDIDNQLDRIGNMTDFAREYGTELAAWLPIFYVATNGTLRSQYNRYISQHRR